MKIGLFIPCYVDALYPEVGVATYKLLTSLGLDVTYPLKQTCCGQPMANAGFEKMATDISRHFDDLFKEFDYVVAPSASRSTWPSSMDARRFLSGGIISARRPWRSGRLKS